MKISPIFAFKSVNNINNKRDFVQNPILNNTSQSDVFIKSSVQQPQISHKVIPFMGYEVHVVDGGTHAKDMQHFAKAIDKNMDISMYPLEKAPQISPNKPLHNLEMQLQHINEYNLAKDGYVAVPVKMTVSLQNLAEQYKRVMGNYLHLRPHSTKTCQQKLLQFLKVLYDEPQKYRKYIEYMDPDNQGIEFAYGVIREINKLKCNKVYVPASSPLEASVNWLARERGETPELTNLLATGYDSDNKVNNMTDYIKSEGWYDFNVLALSDAEVVNLKKADNVSDHIYSAYDTTLKDGARGVYNLTPVRENGEIKGYSFSDDVKNDYPISEFPHQKDVEVVQKFVGLYVDDVVADDVRVAEFKQALEEGRNIDEFSNKLYPTWKLFNEDEMRDNKIYLKGDFVDSTFNHYFRRNADYQIIYPKADAENSGRPSVYGMRDSSLSLFNIIKRDIANQKFYDSIKDDKRFNLDYAVYGYLDNANNYSNSGDLNRAEGSLLKAIDYINIMGFDRHKTNDMRAYKMLADVRFNKGDYLSANGLYNFYLNNFCKNYLEDCDTKTILETEPDRKKIADIFMKLADIAKIRDEYYPEQECKRAALEIYNGSKLGKQVLARRANDDINIGDIFG